MKTKANDKTGAKTKTILLLAAIILMLTAACSPNGNPIPNDNPNQSDNINPSTSDNLNTNDNIENVDSVDSAEVIPIDIGEGAISFIFEVKNDKEDITVWKVHTNEETVGAALLGVGLIDGTVSAMGLMVEYVDGLRADFMEDNAWWAFYIDGEMAMQGVDDTEIEEGTLYAFIFTPA